MRAFFRVFSPLAILCCLVLHQAQEAEATTVEAFSDADLVRYAARIVEGTVVGTRSEWNAAHTQIYSYVDLSVASTYKGTPPADGKLQLKLLGGQVGDVVMEFVGAPKFTTGETVIVFVDSDPAAMIPIVGIFQGKVDMYTDSKTGAQLIRNRSETHDAFVGRMRDIVARQAQEVEKR